MLFRLQMPDITEDRCRACTMLGGYEVQTPADAQRYTAALKRDEVPVSVGDFLDEDPCVGEAGLAFYREHFGRECPRVELDPANEEALALFCFVAGDATRALAPAYFDAACGRLAGDERKRILLRVMATRQDVTIQQIQTERATAARASRREGA